MNRTGLDGRQRDQNPPIAGEIRQKRGDTLNKNLPTPIPQFSPNAKLSTMRKETGKTSERAVTISTQSLCGSPSFSRCSSSAITSSGALKLRVKITVKVTVATGVSPASGTGDFSNCFAAEIHLLGQPGEQGSVSLLALAFAAKEDALPRRYGSATSAHPSCGTAPYTPPRYFW